LRYLWSARRVSLPESFSHILFDSVEKFGYNMGVDRDTDTYTDTYTDTGAVTYTETNTDTYTPPG
jgi:hypothetical protein